MQDAKLMRSQFTLTTDINTEEELKTYFICYYPFCSVVKNLQKFAFERLSLFVGRHRVSLTSDDLVAVVNQGAGQSFAVSKNLRLVRLELWCHGLFESYSNTWQKRTKAEMLTLVYLHPSSRVLS